MDPIDRNRYARTPQSPDRMCQPHRFRPPTFRIALAAGLLLGLAACGEEQRSYEIREVRAFAVPRDPSDPHAGLFDHALRAPGQAGALGGAGTPGRGGLTWTAPAGWVEQAPRNLRLVTYRPSATSTAECYLTVLGPEAGDVVANMNRWRAQMGLARLDSVAFARLPRIQVLGQDLALLEAEGSFRDDGHKIPGEAALLGLVCPQKERALFVKMIGPKEEVKAERSNFEAFCRSLRRTP